ncbi:hypothetical protein I8748_05370 [Nostoc sp. CENA67]|uniref:Uncharacterized protein n=1 Tax=Amazonocrinis nigriterrae CENA67 TaxID=2794033 RepID=A0A8J7HLU2_9NOST|nr:hypothetical protein [Amazonocrinis nigriterrae]MBH8561612.1 hypothetical protein [Amazonocrinis nigriterrae CENA67]
MKRTIVFLISLTLSFLFCFSSIAMAEEIQIQIPEVASQSDKSGDIIQVPPLKVNNANSLMLEAKISTQVLKESPNTNMQSSQIPSNLVCSPRICVTSDRRPGYYLGGQCTPC